MPNPQRNGSTKAWRKLRALVLRRDNGICWMCGQPGADTVDHLVPWAEGGTDHWTNLAACHGSKRPEYNCPGNYSKGAKTQKRKRTVKRQPGPDSGQNPPLGTWSLSSDPSPYPGGYPYERSNPVERECRADGIEE